MDLRNIQGAGGLGFQGISTSPFSCSSLGDLSLGNDFYLFIYLFFFIFFQVAEDPLV